MPASSRCGRLAIFYIGPGIVRQDLAFWAHGGPLKSFERGLHTTLAAKLPFEAILGLFFVGVFDRHQNREFSRIWQPFACRPVPSGHICGLIWAYVSISGLVCVLEPTAAWLLLP